MEIARIEVGRTTGVCTRRERIPAGIAGASVQVSFTDPVWDSLIKTVVFRGKGTRIAEFDGAVAEIPHEVIPEPRIALYFGIFGQDPDTDLQIPLIEVYLGTTEKSTDANADPAADPTLPIWAQLQQDIEEIKQLGPGSGGNVDLSGYATEQFVRDGFQPKGNYLTEHQSLEGYAKSADIPTKPEDIGAQPEGDYALRSEIPSVPVKSVNGKTGAVSLTASEVGALPNTTKIPSKTSDLANDSGYITGYTETDPTVPAWAKQSTKPSYSKSEVGLGNVDNVKQYSASNPPPYPVTSVNGKTGAVSLTIPTVPTKVSAFTNDAGYLTQHQDISGKVNKNGLTLGIHTDGLVYVFVDGVPVGNGIEMGASGDVFGYVDENNNIVVQGNLPDGTYSVKYEMENGSTVNIGNLVLDSNVYYSVTNNLTNCTSNNSATQAIEGKSYSATITAKSGYVLKSVTVTMGGSPVTVSGSEITIANVTGNIVITAVAEVASPAYTNQIPLSTDASGNPFNGGQGWKTGYRLSLSSGGETATDSYECTGFIPVKYGDVVRIKNIDLTAENSTNMICYDSSKNPIKCSGSNNGGQLAVLFTNGACTLNTAALVSLTTSVAFIRIGSKSITANSILTVNQEIV